MSAAGVSSRKTWPDQGPDDFCGNEWNVGRPFAQSFSDLCEGGAVVPQPRGSRISSVEGGDVSGSAGVEETLLRRKSMEQPDDYSNPPSSVKPDVKGVLLKLDGVFSFFWFESFFCIQADRLCWYTISRPNVLACGLSGFEDDMELEGDDSIALSAISKVTLEGPSTIRSGYVFKLRSTDSRVPSLALLAETEEEAVLWVDTLNYMSELCRRPDPLHERATYLHSHTALRRPPQRGVGRTPRQVCVTGSYTVRERSFPYSRHTRYFVTVSALNLTVEHRYRDFDALAAQLRDAGWTPLDSDDLSTVSGSSASTLATVDSAGSRGSGVLKRIPTLPPKTIFNMRYKFVKDRERKLNRFLQRLVAGTDALLLPSDPLMRVKKLTPAGKIIRDFFLPHQFRRGRSAPDLETTSGTDLGTDDRDADCDCDSATDAEAAVRGFRKAYSDLGVETRDDVSTSSASPPIRATYKAPSAGKGGAAAGDSGRDRSEGGAESRRQGSRGEDGGEGQG
eukprot:Rmarinus@m.10708